MIKIDNTETGMWATAFRGMRNPKNSWDKSDSDFTDGKIEIGKNDLKLAKTLATAGTDHGKFLRFITVGCDITAPLYWWKEYDTYKVGTVANSCSTMHKIHEKEFTLQDFSTEHIGNVPNCDPMYYGALECVIMALNEARHCFLDTGDKSYWWQMIQLLPSSYNQKRTVLLNYAVLRNMYHARKDHKLDEWHDFCAWVETLPYAKELIISRRDDLSTE